MRLQNKAVYLRVRPEERSRYRGELLLFHEFDAALEGWGETCRISPLIPLENTGQPGLAEPRRSWMLFFGPVFPGGLAKVWAKKWPATVWLSFGMHNVVVWSSSLREIEDALSRVLTAAPDTPWERWALKSGRIEDVDIGPHGFTKTSTQHFGKPVSRAVRRGLAMAREYEGHIRTAIAASGRFDPRLERDFLEFDRGFRKAISLPEVDSLSRIGLLGNATAVLLRHNSQAYSGTAPILEWPCSIAQHSLLGIGTASMALAGLRRFFHQKAQTHSPVEKLGRLKKLALPSGVPSAGELRSDHPFWRTIESFGQPALLPTGDSGSADDTSDRLPLLTCFSSRDGFRSTPTSLSAPLEVVESGNTQSWTPIIVTHELSHVLVDTCLECLLPPLGNPGELQRATKLLLGEQTPRNTQEWIRELALQGFWLYSGEPGRPSEESLATIIRQHSAQIDEILTDSFDYLCFYRGDDERFVRTIWSSLSVFPYIEARVPEYILRTLCALHTLHFSDRSGISGQTKRLLDLFKLIARSRNATAYIQAAQTELRTHREYYEGRLEACTALVKFARLILAPPSVVRHFSLEPHTARSLSQSASGRGRYTLRPLEFSGELPDNPLRFAESYSADAEPSQARSLWLWQHLAFWKSS